MEFDWWEAAAMFALFVAQFVLPAYFGQIAKWWITWAFLFWAAMAVLRLLIRHRWPESFTDFAAVWQAHVRR
jgi:hypothetical protein